MSSGSEQPIQNIAEAAGAKAPETAFASPETTPEVAPTPASPEKPAAETFAGQAAPVSPGTPQSLVEPAVLPADQTQADPGVEVDDTAPAEETDKQWIEAVEQAIDKNKNLPYEQEEAAEKLSIDYLWKKFKRKIGKDD